MKVYIVQGVAGEYSDKTDWIDSVYKNEESAKERIKLLEQAIESNNKNYIKEIDPTNCWAYNAGGYPDIKIHDDYKPGWWCNEFEVIE